MRYKNFLLVLELNTSQFSSISIQLESYLDENQKNPYFIVKNNFAKLSLEEHGLIRVYRES